MYMKIYENRRQQPIGIDEKFCTFTRLFRKYKFSNPTDLLLLLPISTKPCVRHIVSFPLAFIRLIKIVLIQVIKNFLFYSILCYFVQNYLLKLFCTVFSSNFIFLFFYSFQFHSEDEIQFSLKILVIHRFYTDQ